MTYSIINTEKRGWWKRFVAFVMRKQHLEAARHLPPKLEKTDA